MIGVGALTLNDINDLSVTGTTTGETNIVAGSDLTIGQFAVSSDATFTSGNTLRDSGGVISVTGTTSFASTNGGAIVLDGARHAFADVVPTVTRPETSSVASPVTLPWISSA